MTGYILSVLGIIIAGVLIDIIVPSGNINKYIKGVYSIFVVAVILNPIIKFFNKNYDLTVHYNEININNDLLNYIFNSRAKIYETELENEFKEQGFNNIDIIINFSIENNELKINSCVANLKNLVISKDKQHINKYEFIKKTIKDKLKLTDERIIIDEWKKQKTTS